MIKRTILVLLFVVMAAYVFASPVDPQRAMQVAKQFVPQSTTVKRSPKRGSQTEPSSSIVYTHMMPGGDRPAFYIVNVDGGSFVLVSADDVARPVLGYSLTSKWPVSADSYAELPAHIKGFFDDLAAQMETAIESGPNLAPDEEWSTPKTTKRSPSRGTTNLPDSVGPLLTTTWNQGQYYNVLCPEDVNGPDGHAQNGCVATAMAQIIKYWDDSVQIRLRGTHSYDSNYGTLTVDYNTESYDFANMPNELTAESTPAQVAAVAKLMYHCGVATNMSYGATESSAFDVDARAGLINFYSFSPDLSYAERSFFTDADWNSLLRENIAASRPIIYSGHGVGDHSFILDGYKNNDYYHFNFGWGGFADGWYLTNAVNPGALNFSSRQSALVGIAPDNTSNIILGQTAGTSIFTVDEPLEFYHLMGHNSYEGSNYNNPCNNTVTFISANNENQLVADVIRFEDQRVDIYDGVNTSVQMRNLTGGSENDMSPVVSTQNGITLSYNGNMYYTGFKLMVSQNSDCRMVSNIVSSVEATTVHLSWVENGSATQWQVEYGPAGFKHGDGTVETVNETTITIEGLTAYDEYDFYIRPQCGGSWFGPITVLVLPPYWIDVVTTQPEGYSVDSEDNVIISSVEGLAWWAKLADNQYRHWRWMVYQEPFVPTVEGLDENKLENGWYYACPTTITTDIDLDGYRWKPVSFYADIDGQMHTISNMHIYEDTSLEPEPYYGFLRYFSGPSQIGYMIKDLVFQNPVINCPTGYYGVLAGGTSEARIKNVGANNAVINQYSLSPFISMYNVYGVAGGGLIGHAELTSIDNCYSTGSIVSKYPYQYINNGGIVGYADNLSSFNNCYSSVQIQSQTGGVGSICAFANGLEMKNCYGIDNYPILGQNDLSNGGISDTLNFDKNTLRLNSRVYFDEESCNTLLEALNMRVAYENSETWMTWEVDVNNVNKGFPILSTPYIVTCPNTENIIAKNVMINSQNVLSLTWNNNEDVSYWRIKCIERDAPDNTAHYYLTESNSINITDLTLAKMYRIYVKPICDETRQGGWGEGLQHVYDKPYWTDFVTTQPDGYIIDNDGNVIITSREGFVWLSCLVNGLHGQEAQNFRNKSVKLMVNVDLSDYRWRPIGNTWWNTFDGSFDGNNHTISNLYVNEYHDWVGLFGHVYQGKFVNITIENSIVKGFSNVGTICGMYQNVGYDWNYGDVLFDNCHVKNASVYGDNLVGGIGGRIENRGDETGLTIVVRNCFSSGEVHGSNHVGGLIGNIKDFAKIGNCYSTCDIYATEMDAGGLIGFTKSCVLENSYATGIITSTGGSYGKLVGYLCDNITCHYMYGLEDEKPINLFGYVGDYCTIDNFEWFTSAGVIKNAIIHSGTSYTDLVDALNAWVDANNTNGKYRHWIADTANVNGGYPILAPLPNSIVTFRNYDNTVLQKDTLTYGSLPVYRGDTPAKEATAQYTYIFKGWTPAIIPATEDAVYTATYDSIVNKYVITFCNENNTVLQTDTLEYGATPSYRGDTPVKEATTMYTYIFSGWLPELSPVTSNATYTAVFDAVERIYGDVTGNRIVDIQDATIVVNYILGERSDNYLYYMADMNNDEEIDIFDLTAIINVILGKPNFTAPMRASGGRYETGNYISSNTPVIPSVGLEDAYLQVISNKVYLSIDDTQRFTSFQMDVEVPDGAELLNVEVPGSKKTHSVQKAKIGDNLYRVIGLSMTSIPLAEENGELVNFQISNSANTEVTIKNILFVMPNGEAHYFNESSTMIPTILNEVSSDKEEIIFDLSGRRINKKPEDLDKGIYIINNEKVIIK